MKYKNLFIAGFVFAACSQNNSKTALKNFIPGTYVRTISHEFAIGSDSIIISTMKEGMNTYKIEKRSGFRQMHDGIVFPFKQNKETWTGVLDLETGLIHETREGRILSFIRQERTLLVGGTKYVKQPPTP